MAAACWKGVCKRGYAAGEPAEDVASLLDQKADACAQFTTPVHVEPVRTFSAPAPSPSYVMSEELERLEKAKQMPTTIPQDIKDDMQRWRLELAKAHEEKERQAKAQKEGPGVAPGFFHLTVVDEGCGHRKPQVGSKVKLGYAVVLESDESVLDMKPEFEYVLGQEERGTGEVLASVLDGMLVQMRRGEVASITHPVGDLFPSSAPQVQRSGPEVDRAVCEVTLHEIYVTKDCSFEKGAEEVMKEVVKDGVGAWCDNPTDEGMAVIRIEEVRTSEGAKIFPEPGASAMELCASMGDGQVCDALECALLEMRQHETALVTCTNSALLLGGAPFGDSLPAVAQQARALTLRVTLLDYNKGPDAASFDEEDRLPFALRRKAEANRLFGEGRFRLARERYRQINLLFHHLDRPKTKDRFLGKPELFQDCRKLRIDCRLNIAACSIKLQDPKAAKEACDLVLQQVPESTKAFFRRAQAHMQQRDFVQACRDLQRLLEIDPKLLEARRLLEKAKKLREDSDKKQKGAIKCDRMVSKIKDDRTDKYDYLDAPLDMDEMEGLPVSAWAQHGREMLRR
eukprot:gb/GFBE01031563.1/.p1 GENE.gb/GFBE01031563.1/~~gb/GFBE01031563.1/.p1  ORF type:complete len:569 (+),score=183.42 gb/GFBE01031563.1/:1-1707(+)